LRSSPQLPIFASAADDDAGAVETLQWIVGVSRNPGNQFQRYQTGGHGIEMFAPHPELTGLIVNWFDTTLLKTPGHAPVNTAQHPGDTSILETIDEPGGAAKAAEMLAEARKANPNATLFPETIVNVIGYEHLQEGDNKGAIEIFKLNSTAFPNSPNTYDSLSDALIADGQSEAAIQSSETALKLLESDKTDSEERRKLIRQSAERKLKQLKPGN
jgi:tetratricopeptide (TPR) repeat protein